MIPHCSKSYNPTSTSKDLVGCPSSCCSVKVHKHLFIFFVYLLIILSIKHFVWWRPKVTSSLSLFYAINNPQPKSITAFSLLSIVIKKSRCKSSHLKSCNQRIFGIFDYQKSWWIIIVEIGFSSSVDVDKLPKRIYFAAVSSRHEYV